MLSFLGAESGNNVATDQWGPIATSDHRTHLSPRIPNMRGLDGGVGQYQPLFWKAFHAPFGVP